MSNPDKYVPSYSFGPTPSAFPSTQLNNEFAQIKATTDATIDALLDIRRSDGALRNGIVTADSLAEGLTFSGDAVSLPFSAIFGLPSTLGGYGITDGYTKTQVDTLISAGTGISAFSELTGKPTTLGGYGITDGYTKAQVDTAIAATGITAGTTSQYWRGDKTWQTLDKAAVGLGNVANLAPADYPVSTAQAIAIAAGGGSAGPLILPITLTSPAASETGVGTGGGYTFVGTGYYSDYGIVQASRAVRIYDAAGTTLVTTYTTAGAGTAVFASLAAALAVSTAYKAEMVYTDVLGNTTVSPKVAFTTASAFKPAVGQAYLGGFLAFENFGDGLLYDLVVAAKSNEASKPWFSSSVLGSVFSRMNGPKNTDDIITALTGGGTTYAAPFAKTLSIGGVAAYLGAIDELRAISSKLKPSAATQAAFQSGGAEVFASTNSWSSTEQTSAAASAVNISTGTEDNGYTKTVSLLVRPIKRVTVATTTQIGDAIGGGYLAAYFTDLSTGTPVTYMLIVADKATETTKAWDTGSATTTSIVSRTDGKTGTEGTLNASRYAAAKYCADLSSGGQTDWYLPAIDELWAIARQAASLPSGQNLLSGTNVYWSSTEDTSSNAKALTTSTLVEQSVVKTDTSRSVRPIRRVAI